MKGLTQKQRNILQYIGEFMNEMGMAPTVYEIAGHFGIKTSTVFAHIRALQRKGFLSRSSKARSISLLKEKRKQRKATGVHAIPVIESDSEKNILSPAREVFCDSAFLGAEHVSSPKELYALRVQGGDVRDFGILDGDIAIVRKDAGTLKNGDIVVTLVNGKPMLRGFCPDSDGSVELRGSGEVTKCSREDLMLQGVVVGVQRRM